MTWTRRRTRALLQRPSAARARRGLRAGHPQHRQDPARRRQDRPARYSTGSSRRRRTRHTRSTAARRAAASRRSPTTLIVHIARTAHRCSRAPARSVPRPPSDSPATRAASPSSRAARRDLVHSRVTRCASYAQQRALHKRQRPLPIPRLHRNRDLEAHHINPVGTWRQDRTRQPHPALPPAPQAPARSPHPRQWQRRPARLQGRSRTRDHRQPATRTTPLTVSVSRPTRRPSPPSTVSAARRASPRRPLREARRGRGGPGRVTAS